MISTGELLFFIGLTAYFIGPKELPKVARVGGRYVGRAIAYVQMARGQFDTIVHQTQAHQVQKELRETMSQLEAIRHEIRSVSFMNPGSLTSRLVDNLDKISTETVENAPGKEIKEPNLAANNSKAHGTSSPDIHSQPATNAKFAYSLKDQSARVTSPDSHSQATAYARLAESTNSNPVLREFVDKSGHVIVLPVSAESAELLPKRKDGVSGSDIVLEAVLEAEVAKNAKEYFSKPENLKT